MLVNIGLVIAFALLTPLLGWWAVPLVAIVVGVLFRASGGRSKSAAWCAVAAWAILLEVDASRGGFPRVAGAIGGAMGVPWIALAVLTLAFAGLLAWSAATVAAEAARRLSPSE